MFCITLSIGFQLREPKIEPRFWQARELAIWIRMAMPKTSVNKESQLMPSQNKVRFSRQSGDMKPVPVAHGVDRPADAKFRTGVPAFNPRHPLTALMGTERVQTVPSSIPASDFDSHASDVRCRHNSEFA
jgi:hypothetical protein